MKTNQYRYSCLIVLLCAFYLLGCGLQAQDKVVTVNAGRLNESLQKLATFGKDENGTNRLAYSDADKKGRSYAMRLMQEAGLEVSIDFAGNIIGKRVGKDPNKKPIAFGSHIDTVPNGGDYDGCVGSMSAIEVVQTMMDKGISTDHPLEVILFSNEEGGVVGSRAMIGTIKLEGLSLTNKSGLTVREGIKELGGDPDRLQESFKKKGDYAAFLELHIEQGGILADQQLDIGVVEGIVGIEIWKVTVEGFSNHAGTTPMNMRQDALLAASKMIIAINDVITSTEGQQVGTVGMIDLEPGAMNVVPGKVSFTLEIRDLSKEKVWKLAELIKERAKLIEQENNTPITFELLDISGTPALANAAFQEAIIQSAETLGLSYQRMPSGAGHDAQEIAQIAPIGMIFVPSVDGISHSPKEYSKPEDITNGANVLLNTILTLDKKLD